MKPKDVIDLLPVVDRIVASSEDLSRLQRVNRAGLTEDAFVELVKTARAATYGRLPATFEPGTELSKRESLLMAQAALMGLELGNQLGSERAQSHSISALGWLSSTLADRSRDRKGKRPKWFPEPPEWMELWDDALMATVEEYQPEQEEGAEGPISETERDPLMGLLEDIFGVKLGA